MTETVTFLQWLAKQQHHTGEQQILAEFAKAVNKTITLMSFAMNTQVNCRKMWQMMGDLRNQPNVQMTFLAAYIMYMGETGQEDKDAEYVVDEITSMMESMMSMAKNQVS